MLFQIISEKVLNLKLKFSYKGRKTTHCKIHTATACKRKKGLIKFYKLIKTSQVLQNFLKVQSYFCSTLLHKAKKNYLSFMLRHNHNIGNSNNNND